jgi:hypothetical protein
VISNFVVVAIRYSSLEDENYGSDFMSIIGLRQSVTAVELLDMPGADYVTLPDYSRFKSI